ncbi:AAA domain-containing protein [Nocardia sp. NPDC046763]|uniref:caspase, EACC1-associated type n=1 Tax=Nocardia sp. NPDC046763 TaxID=3155256 RepID=UPI0033F86774
MLIGTETYADPFFNPLPSVQADVWQLEQVLSHRQIGRFSQVIRRVDLTAEQMCAEIAEFLDGCEEDDLALLYVSGHGDRLVQASGEFHFVATDTDHDRIADTAVSAGFVNDQLELCVAPQKVVMIDSCLSGGFALGFRTAEPEPAQPTAKGRPDSGRSPLESRGVYVLSSSRAREVSRAGAGTPDGPEPSVFTGVVVEALRTGRVGKDGTGQVSVQELFEHVNKHMRAHTTQVPVLHATGVDDRILIASCPQGTAPVLAPLSARPVPTASTAKAAGAAPPSWSNILEYYRRCLRTDQYEVPWLSVDDHGDSYVCLQGTERILCGELDDDHCVEVPLEAIGLVAQAVDSDDELWAGYPAMVAPPRGKRQDRTPHRFAPLLIRRVEVAETGRVRRLQPTGAIFAHPALAAECLGEEEAALFNETFRPGWHAGQHDRMAVDVRKLAEEFELGCVEEPQPDLLFDHIDVHTPQAGGRNAAVLFRVSRHPGATNKLLKDLDDIDDRSDVIGQTALAALSPDPVQRAEPAPDCDPDSVRLVTPLLCNEAQEAVIRSAMTRRLTIATGPPGTGKSQLVANLVATAVADGQSVLVASTNNKAVNEVWQRCCKVVPGSVVRTGNFESRSEEVKTLEQLTKAPAPAANIETTAMHLYSAAAAWSTSRHTLARKATCEAALLQAGQDRETHAAEIGSSVPELIDKVSPLTPRTVADRALKLSKARFFGEWRRRRLLDRCDIAVSTRSTAELCNSLAGFTDAHDRWINRLDELSQLPTDDDAWASYAANELEVHEGSTSLFSTTVKTLAREGHTRITELLRSLNTQDEWKSTRAALPILRAWAVTTLSARRFPPDPALFDLVVIDEASQCAIPQVLPLLFRARRALVIGDPMQLEHIVDITADDEAKAHTAAGVTLTWLEHHRLSYRRHSSFRAAERAVGRTLLLDEHFRCHPRIAALANELFYDGQLTVMTDVRGRPTLPRPAVVWVPTTGNAEHPRSSLSWINPTEVAKVRECVEFVLRRGGLPADASIGVVTPYRAQKEAIRAAVGNSLGDDDIGTVHTFQGGERDVMIFSLVAGPGMPRRSINRIDNQLNLWNVAITRAKSHLIVVGDKDLWRQRRIASALLDAADNSDGHASTVGRGPDPLAHKLFEWLGGATAKVELGEAVCGHRTDAVVHGDDGRKTAYVLDRGPAPETEPARHLRLMLRRTQLRTDPTGATTALRVPAWKLYDSTNSA